MKKNLALIISLVLVLSLFSCLTYQRSTKEVSSSFPVVSNLMIDNVITLKDLKEVGTVSVSMTVTEEYFTKEDKLILQIGDVQLVRDFKKDKGKMKITGDFQFGNFTEIRPAPRGNEMVSTTISSYDRFMKMLAAYEKALPFDKYFRARDLALSFAQQKAIDEAIKLGGSALFMPYYSWNVASDDSYQKFLFYPMSQVGNYKYVYTVGVVAKAVSFIATN